MVLGSPAALLYKSSRKCTETEAKPNARGKTSFIFALLVFFLSLAVKKLLFFFVSITYNFFCNKKINKQTIDIVRWTKPSVANEEGAERKPTDLNNFESLFEELAKFMKTLPPKSKKHIWEHAVTDKDKKEKKEKKDKKDKKVFDKASKEEHITRLLCDCVIVYIKYLNRKEKPLKTQEVLPHVEPVSRWIFQKYGELDRHRFEQESAYFSGILEEYQVNARAH
ncbi:hypothetical protein RFI_11362 [Reticulomyxa filosa]|uniref:Uncharacterized protein n=1 Tax=Reticulomyxa filosa TaxID=46433 RepID=X6NK80_RETFI|nr:hypothetical protein RFI_11362 [Reticulomyxa filosa]|eukprot:ETO25772.1 hypothetical protein RFI_11362 [Reticulomyxa filosa]